jgi:hypothetical protein
MVSDRSWNNNKNDKKVNHRVLGRQAAEHENRGGNNNDSRNKFVLKPDYIEVYYFITRWFGVLPP